MKGKDTVDVFAKGARALGVGVYDGLTARIAENAGYSFLWLSSFSLSARRGHQDTNIVAADTLVSEIVALRQASRLPIVVDGDNAFGSAEHCHRLGLACHASGAHAVAVEDSAFPKRCSFYESPQSDLQATSEFAAQIRRLKTYEITVVARTEALIAGQGTNEAITRLCRYREAGADALFVQVPIGGLRLLEETLDGLAHLGAPIMVTPTGLPSISADDLFDLGCDVVAHANIAIRAATLAVTEALTSMADRRLSVSRLDTRLAGMVAIETLTDAADSTPSTLGRVAR